MTHSELLALKRELDEKLKLVCVFCGEKAEYLCDFKIGYDKNIDPLYKSSDQAFTCDAPLCDRHRINLNIINIKGLHLGEHYDTIDYCCIGHDRYKKPKPMTWDQANKIRLEHYSRRKQ